MYDKIDTVGMAAACSNDKLSGILKTNFSFAITYSAYEPFLEKAMTRSPIEKGELVSVSTIVPATSKPKIKRKLPVPLFPIRVLISA